MSSGKDALEKAQKLMQEAVHAMLECKQYKCAHVTAIRTQVEGQQEDVMCVFFGGSEEVLASMATRVMDSSIEERIARSLAHNAIVNAANKPSV